MGGMMKLIRVCDFETTGLNPASSSVCEVATVDLTIEGDRVERIAMRWELVKPLAPIPPEASAIHDITDDMVEDKPGFADFLGWLNRGPPDAFCAHNASFEQGYFRPPNVPWLCTYKLALWLWPDCPVHSIACLRYWLKLKLAPPDIRQRSHSAMWDAYLCAAVLRRVIVSGASWDDMLTVSSEPAVLPRLTFGEHAMKPIADVPGDYLQWIMKKGGGEKGFSEDVLHTAMHELRRRRDDDRVQV